MSFDLKWRCAATRRGGPNRGSALAQGQLPPPGLDPADRCPAQKGVKDFPQASAPPALEELAVACFPGRRRQMGASSAFPAGRRQRNTQSGSGYGGTLTPP